MMMRRPILRLAVVLAIAGCHPAPRTTVTPPPSPPVAEEPAVPTDFPTLPAGDAVPSTAEVAALIASTFPADQRAAATTALSDEILPWDLRNLPGHPNPRRLVELVYEKLARELGDDPAARPARLADMRCARRGQRLTQRVHGLAVARYLRDRGGRIPAKASAGDVDPARPFLALGDGEFTAAVAAAAADVEAWRTDAEAAHPACWSQQYLDHIHDRFALDSARTGQFAAASGYLYVFLRSVGERPRQIDVH